MNIVEALDHPELFAPHFTGATWLPWGAFLAALFGLPLDDAALAIYRHHTGRVTAPLAAFTEACVVVGRRGGKSIMLALVAVFLACFRDYGGHLAAGEVATVAVIAASRAQARAIFRFVSGLLHAVPALEELIAEESGDAIVLNNRVTIEIHTASFRVTRGYTLVAALCDETAFWRDETSANPDVEIFRALRPGLANIPGAMLLNASSPYRKAGVLYTQFSRHYGKDDSRVLVWRGTTLEMNPGLDPAIVAQAYEDDPESAAAEFGAEFRGDIADFVSRDVVEACTVPGRFELGHVPGTKYAGFVDLSGGGADSMTLAIAHRDRTGIAVLDAIREIRPPCSPEGVVVDFAITLKGYRVNRVTGDRYAGDWPRERFRNAGITYDVSERTKGDIYVNALPLLNSRRVELLDVKRLASQLIGLERRTARSGHDSIDHAPGGHDDVANAAMGALLLVGGGRAPMRINPEAIQTLMGYPPGMAPWV
jgi:hypothetical protein